MVHGTRTIIVAATCAATVLLAMVAAMTPAEAKRGHYIGGHRAHVGHALRGGHHVRHHGHLRAQPHRRLRHWRRDVTLGLGSAFVAGCAFEYRKWKVTGSRYWRNRYFDCAG
jgi:hypothetical protein